MTVTWHLKQTSKPGKLNNFINKLCFRYIHSKIPNVLSTPPLPPAPSHWSGILNIYIKTGSQGTNCKTLQDIPKLSLKLEKNTVLEKGLRVEF